MTIRQYNSRKIINSRGNICNICDSTKNLVVHHSHYNDKYDSELEVVCRKCHSDLHINNNIAVRPSKCKPIKINSKLKNILLEYRIKKGFKNYTDTIIDLILKTK